MEPVHAFFELAGELVYGLDENAKIDTFLQPIDGDGGLCCLCRSSKCSTPALYGPSIAIWDVVEKDWPAGSISVPCMVQK